ncbi:hypothetical protein JKP88DRAFT_206079 [Tribonema minus]|uniref:Uncharacterized protein n=1 Tax=Tribonema minus TaxID=303371 RepID=A0A835Z9K9_9STRA|nr:hypothetical protein JKP88DRAFT_206079 [Tribonema minus]
MLKEASGTFKLRNPEWSLNEVRHAECFSAAQTLSASGYSFDYFSRTGVADWLDRCRQEPPCLECEKFYVGGILADPQCSETGDDELVVHLRSGDIWSEKPHKRYGQPPLSSYAAVLAHRSWKKILIVTEPTPELLRHPFAAILPAMVRQTVADTVQILDFTSDLRTLLCARALVASHSTLTTMYLMHNQRLQSLYADALMHGTQLHNVNGQEVCSAPGAAVLSVSDLLAARPSLSIFLMPLSEEWTPTYTPYGAWKNTYAQRVEMLSAGWGPLLQQPPPPMIECRAGE